MSGPISIFLSAYTCADSFVSIQENKRYFLNGSDIRNRPGGCPWGCRVLFGVAVINECI